MASPFSYYQIKCFIATPIFIKIHKGNLSYALSFTSMKNQGCCLFFFNEAKQQTLHKILHTRRRDINKGHNISPVKRQADINAGIDLGL